ncbi:MAG: PEGA domain-containing protein [Labilithrix sp.]|nr:PEGA domain-containing protein [Labilithrix sp.]MCW5818043.1 PEGA domain-containing protein [Labilithrix sp.]
MRLRATCLAIALALGCVQNAHAQGKTTEASAVDPATRDRSRAAFRKGVSQLRAQDYSGARASFEEAYELVPHTSILLNLGISRLKTGDPVLAEGDLSRFLQEDTGAPPEELASARDALAEAKKQIGTLKVTVTPPTAQVTVDGSPLTLRDGAGEVRLKAGSHAISAEADGFTPVEKTADVAGKGEAKLEIALEAKTPAGPAPPPEGETPPDKDGGSMRPIAGYALAGVSGVALIVTTVLGVRTLGLASDYEAEKDPTARARLKDEGESARTGTDVALVVALLAGAGAVILLFTDIGASHEPAAPSSPSTSSRWPARWLGGGAAGGPPAILRW